MERFQWCQAGLLNSLLRKFKEICLPFIPLHVSSDCFCRVVYTTHLQLLSPRLCFWQQTETTKRTFDKQLYDLGRLELDSIFHRWWQMQNQTRFDRHLGRHKVKMWSISFFSRSPAPVSHSTRFQHCHWDTPGLEECMQVLKSWRSFFAPRWNTNATWTTCQIWMLPSSRASHHQLL